MDVKVTLPWLVRGSGVVVAAIYVLCAVVSVACAVALLLIYRDPHVRPTRLIMWTTVCSACLSVNNPLMVADVVAASDVALGVPRACSKPRVM